MHRKASISLPSTVFIGDSHENLYKAEKAFSTALQNAAKEAAKVLGHTEDEYWNKSIPFALLSLLNNFQQDAAVAAAIAFLREHGIAVNNGISKPILSRFRGTFKYDVSNDGVIEIYDENGRVE